jgi:hypothetical protein
MAIGFTRLSDFDRIVGWELYQVTIDKYHVMFWFENKHALLNVADRFSYRSSDGLIDYAYEIYGDRKFLNLDPILRIRIERIVIVSKDRLDLIFENGDTLSVYDNPDLCSWWFLGGRREEPELRRTTWAFEVGDREPEDLTEAERLARRAP